MATGRDNLTPHRWVVRVLALAAVVLVPWTFVLAYRLPAQHSSEHWDVAWVGFDVALSASLAATGVAIARRSPWASAVASVAAALLLCDAWFDNLLASGFAERVEAAVEAGVVELPLAALCLWLVRDAERSVEVVRSAFERR